MSDDLLLHGQMGAIRICYGAFFSSRFSWPFFFSLANVIRDYVCRLPVMLRVRHLMRLPGLSRMFYSCAHVNDEHTIRRNQPFLEHEPQKKTSYSVSYRQVRVYGNGVHTHTHTTRHIANDKYILLLPFLHPFVFNFANLLSKHRKHMAHANRPSIHDTHRKTNEYCQI